MNETNKTFGGILVMWQDVLDFKKLYNNFTSCDIFIKHFCGQVFCNMYFNKFNVKKLNEWKKLDKIVRFEKLLNVQETFKIEGVDNK